MSELVSLDQMAPKFGQFFADKALAASQTASESYDEH
jgi:hypothetical protein